MNDTDPLIYFLQIIREEFYLMEGNKEFKRIYLHLKCLGNVLNNSVQMVYNM